MRDSAEVHDLPCSRARFRRLCAILYNTPSIRDTIAFPKTAKGVNLITDTPTPVAPKQLRGLYIDVKVQKPKGFWTAMASAARHRFPSNTARR